MIDPQTNTLGSVDNAASYACHARAEEWGFAWSTPRLFETVTKSVDRPQRHDARR